MNDPATARAHGSPASLDSWIRSLHKQDLPVLNNTIHELSATTADRESSASDLARVVLNDAALTSDVIRTANSAYYNPAGLAISTVSRAVILLGFSTVHGMGLSLAVIDTLVRGSTRDRVHRVFAECLHAAVQARTIAEQSGDPSPEEVFIAGLLYRVGELAFWCFTDDDTAASMEQALASCDGDERSTQREVLGFSLRELSRRLAREWRLGETLQDALRPGRATSRRGAIARCAHEVVSRLATGQPGTAAAPIMELTGMEEKTALGLIARARDTLPEVARALGVRLFRSEGGDESGGAQRETAATRREPAPMLQLRVLREMVSTARESRNLQAIFDLATEGVYRGLALDRCAIAVVSRDRQSLVVRSVLGDNGELRTLLESIALGDPACRVLRQRLEEGKSLWAGPGRTSHMELPETIAARLGPDWLLGVLTLGSRPVGLMIADRRPGSRPVEEATFDGFCHFVEQAALCMGNLASGGN